MTLDDPTTRTAASWTPVEAPEGTAAVTVMPPSVTRSTWEESEVPIF